MNLWVFISSLVLSLFILVPLGMKWEIEKKVTIPASILIGILSGSVTHGITRFWNPGLFELVMLEVFLITTISISSLLWRFYRDPQRVPPEDKDTILSPADGKVIYVKKIEKGRIPFSEKKEKKIPLKEFVQSDLLPGSGHIIGISMNFLDVHVNRAPIWGRISLLKRIKGLFISLKRWEAIVQNERVLTVIDNGQFRVGIVQISSRLVRKIVPYCKEGQEVQRGERVGVIRLGSQVDLILPDIPSIHVWVRPGEKVKAGLSIVATVEDVNLGVNKT